MVRLSVHKCFGSAEILLISQGWYFRLDALHPLHYPPNDLAISDCKHGSFAEGPVAALVRPSGISLQSRASIGTQRRGVHGQASEDVDRPGPLSPLPSGELLLPSQGADGAPRPRRTGSHDQIGR